MKLSNFGRASELVAARNKLLIQRDDSGIDVLIRGEPQHEDFVDVIAPAVRLELGRRIAAIDAKLQRLGVDVDSIFA